MNLKRPSAIPLPLSPPAKAGDGSSPQRINNLLVLLQAKKGKTRSFAIGDCSFSFNKSFVFANLYALAQCVQWVQDFGGPAPLSCSTAMGAEQPHSQLHSTYRIGGCIWVIGHMRNHLGALRAEFWQTGGHQPAREQLIQIGSMQVHTASMCSSPEAVLIPALKMHFDHLNRRADLRRRKNRNC